MVLVRILQRRDAASLVVAIALGMALAQFITSFTSHLAFKVIGEEGFGGLGGNDWKAIYLQPLVWLVLQIVLLEVLARLVVLVRAEVVRRRPR